jgi:glucose-1-phosphate adenylyltransferase
MKNVLCLILGGGRGSQLYPLTLRRSEPAVPIAGKYRLIDIPVSNCLNSGINRIYVLTQFLSASLHRHIANTYKLAPFSQGFVEVLAAQQTNETTDWFKGTADAVRQQIRHIREDPGKEVLVLYGDQLYMMDFRQLVREHREQQADVTVGVVPVAEEAAEKFGILHVANDGRVVELVEKPGDPQTLRLLRMPEAWLASRGCQAGDKPYLANMGIYLFRRDLLLELLDGDNPPIDFVHDVLLRALGHKRVLAHLFRGYWDDLGSVRSYYEANLRLTDDDPPFTFYSSKGIIFTRARNLPAARLSGAKIERALVSDGCVVGEGSQLSRCIIGVRAQIGPNTVIRNSVILGTRHYEPLRDRAENQQKGLPPMGIGANSRIEGAIIDKDCRIGQNVRIVNESKRATSDGPNYFIRDGIVVLPDGAIVPDGTVI